MNLLDALSGLLLLAALGFFGAGLIALWRFPDLYCRLHALTKADNTGLGLTVLALMLQSTSVSEALKLALIWSLMVAASATVSFLVANEARRRELAIPPEDPQ